MERSVDINKKKRKQHNFRILQICDETNPLIKILNFQFQTRCFTFVIRFISTCLSNEKLKDMAQKERVKPVKYINTVKYINYFDMKKFQRIENLIKQRREKFWLRVFFSNFHPYVIRHLSSQSYNSLKYIYIYTSIFRVDSFV